MASQMIWLFSYVSLGLALTLGNRPGVHNQRGQFRSRYDHRLKTFDRPIGGSSGATATSIGKKESTSESDSSYRYRQEPEPYDLPPDWNIYNDENTRDPPDNQLVNNLHGGINNFLLDQFTNAMFNTFNSNGQIMSNNEKNIIHNDEINSLSKHLIQQRQKQHNNHNKNNNNNNNINNNKLSRSIGINNNDDLTSIQNHYYNLNGELNDEENKLTMGSRKSSSSLWSIENKDYPLRVNPMDEMRYPSSSIAAHARIIGKRNQATTGRRRMIDSRSSTATSTTQQHQQQTAGQSSSSSSSSSLGPGVSSPGISSGGIASQFMLRAARGNRQYDVPQIECPPSEDGMERFACPTPDRMGRYRCIDDHVLCNGFFDCPFGEDEDRQSCMFYKTTKAHLDVLAEALLRWVRAR